MIDDAVKGIAGKPDLTLYDVERMSLRNRKVIIEGI